MRMNKFQLTLKQNHRLSPEIKRNEIGCPEDR